MVRLGISVEGSTEKVFVEKVLSPYLESKDIQVVAIAINGNVGLDKIRDELKRIAYSFEYLSTLYDLYGFRGKQPGETKVSLEGRIQGAVAGSIAGKLIPYVQKYEFEGLLFSSPQVIASQLEDDSLVGWAESVLTEFNGDPEEINDSVNTAPSKRLRQHTSYKKSIHAVGIAMEIGIDAMREKCTGFDAWVSRLEGLGADN